MNMRKWFALLLVVAMLITAAGCGAGAAAPVDEDPEVPVDDDVLPTAALVLAGPISDMGWNASAYEGLMLIQEEFGVGDVSFAESVAQSDMEDVMRNYAVLGYDVIFAHGSEFQDATLIVAAEFSETMFVIINGNAVEDNVVSVRVSNDQQGFLMGIFAGMMTETGTVGVMGGALLENIVAAVDGFEAGVRYVDPSVTVLRSMTGSFDDVNAAKETAIAYIDNGADYVGAIANQAGLGSIQAAEERGVYAIGSNTDQFEAAPTAVVVSVVRYVPRAVVFAYENLVAGTLESQVYSLGYNEGVIFYSSFHDFEDFVPDEVKARLDEITGLLAAGEISVPDLISEL